MTENRENWLYPEASGLYFPHDGFIMRASDGKQYDYEEECELLNEYHKGYNECRDDVLRLEKENEQLKSEINSFKKEVMTVIARYWKRDNTAISVCEVLESILDDLELELVL